MTREDGTGNPGGIPGRKCPESVAASSLQRVAFFCFPVSGCMTVLAGADWPIERMERQESGGAGLSSGHLGRSEHGEREFEL
jgi:hypothetical protein